MANMFLEVFLDRFAKNFLHVVDDSLSFFFNFFDIIFEQFGEEGDGLGQKRHEIFAEFSSQGAHCSNADQSYLKGRNFCALLSTGNAILNPFIDISTIFLKIFSRIFKSN